MDHLIFFETRKSLAHIINTAIVNACKFRFPLKFVAGLQNPRTDGFANIIRDPFSGFTKVYSISALSASSYVDSAIFYLHYTIFFVIVKGGKEKIQKFFMKKALHRRNGKSVC